MSRPHEPHRPSFPFGNPFRMMRPKGSFLNSKLLALLNAFEETLAERLRKLKLNVGRDTNLSLAWMHLAIETLCDIHKDIMNFITELELPVCDWEDKWIDFYLDDSVKILDICIAFSSELSRLSQGHVLLQCALHGLDSALSRQAYSSFDSWRQHINSKNQKLDNCNTILDDLIKSVNLPKVKNSAKGKVLMRAMYGVKVSSMFICAVCCAIFSGSGKNLKDFQALGHFLWAETFTDVQRNVNMVIRNLCSRGSGRILKELEAVDESAKKLNSMAYNECRSAEAEAIRKSILDLRKDAENLSQGLDVLVTRVDDFFQIVLSGRDALLSNLRAGEGGSDLFEERNRGRQARR